MALDDPASGCGAPPATLMDQGEAASLAGVAKALSDPVRFRIFAHVASSGRGGTVCACHLPGALGISQPTLSHHLKKLVETGLVEREYRGRWAHYSPRPEGVAALCEFLDLVGSAPTGAGVGQNAGSRSTDTAQHH